MSTQAPWLNYQAGAEARFQSWYATKAKKLGLDPNPDDPEHYYDYRAAFRAGVEPDATGHWPSEFKLEGHPRMVVDGINTKTGEKVRPPWEKYAANNPRDEYNPAALGYGRQAADPEMLATPEYREGAIGSAKLAAELATVPILGAVAAGTGATAAVARAAMSPAGLGAGRAVMGMAKGEPPLSAVQHGVAVGAEAYGFGKAAKVLGVAPKLLAALPKPIAEKLAPLLARYTAAAAEGAPAAAGTATAEAAPVAAEAGAPWELAPVGGKLPGTPHPDLPGFAWGPKGGWFRLPTAPASAAGAAEAAPAIAERAAEPAANAGFKTLQNFARENTKNPKLGQKVWLELDKAGDPVRTLSETEAGAAKRMGKDTTWVKLLSR